MSPKISSVCVYCGSSGRVSDTYKQAATDFGKIIAQNNAALVYGGGRVGLMGLVADSVMANNGKVVGIIPHHIESREVAHQGLTELYVVDSMHIRKQMMVEKSDAFVVLPGGIGTLDEVCEILTWKQLGMHDKPIVIANIDNYWKPFGDMVAHIIESGFMRAEDARLMTVVDTVEEIFPALIQAPGEAFDPASKWI